jgi:hypothetical protein
MTGVHGADQILEELEVDGELVLARHTLCVEQARAGDSALHVDDTKTGAAYESIEELFAVGGLATKKRQRKIDSPTLAGRRLIGATRAKPGTGPGGDPVEKAVG